jgi:CheY-like chemotaxis protein
LMGGKLHVVNLEEGKGSEFSFLIKLERLSIDEDKIWELKFSDDNIEPFINLKILFVEDNPLNIILIKNIFKNQETQIEIVENGKLACELLTKKSDFNIIFMDINMPVMNGIQATLYIRKCLKLTIPIIGFTANNSVKEKEFCLENGMNDYITKILVFNDFFKILHRLLNELKKNDKINLNEMRKNLSSENNNTNNNKNTSSVFEADYSNPLSDCEDSTTENSSKSNGDNICDISNIKRETQVFDFNPENMNEFCDGDNSVKKEILTVFVKETREELKILELAFQERNEGNLRFYIHKMKTPLLMLGFENILEELLKIREMSKKVDTSNTAVVKSFVKLKEAFERTLNCIIDYVEDL